MLHYARALLSKAATALAAVVPADSYTEEQISPGDATCSITFASSGAWSSAANNNENPSGTWKTGGGTGASYWIKWTNTTGTLSAGTAGSWLQLSANRTFSVTFTAISGSKTCTGTVQIATDAAGSNIIATGSITIQALVAS